MKGSGVAAVLVGALAIVTTPVVSIASQMSPHDTVSTANTAQVAVTGSLTIRKSLSVYDTPGQPLTDIEFSISRVKGIDVGTAAGWDEVAALTAATVHDTHGVEEISIQPAVFNGTKAVAHFTDLVQGVYLVREKPGRYGDVSLSASSPFLITVPLNNSHEAQSHVTIETKAQTLSILLSSDREVVKPGGLLVYSTVSTVPLPDRGGALYRYVVHGRLDKGVSGTGSPTVELYTATSGEQPGTQPQSWALKAGVDYEVLSAGREVAITFTQAGLETLAQLRMKHSDLVVRSSFQTRVDSGVVPGTDLDMVMLLAPDGYPEQDRDRVESNTVVVKVVQDSADITTLPQVPWIPGVPVIPPGQGSTGGNGTKDNSSRPSGSDVTQLLPDNDTSVGTNDPGLRTVGAGLASTGADVIALVTGGLGISLVGLLLMWRNSRGKTSHAVEKGSREEESGS